MSDLPPKSSSARRAPRPAAGAKKKRLLVIGAVVAAGAAFAAGLATAQLARQDAGKIAPGVRVAGVAVSGLSPKAATTRVRRWARGAQARPITLVAPRSGRTWNLSLGEAGGRFDVAGAVAQAHAVGKSGSWLAQMIGRVQAAQSAAPITPAFHLDEARLREQVVKIARAVNVPARSAQARLDSHSGLLLLSRPERKGVRVEVNATLAALLKNGESALRDGEKAALVIREEKPTVTAADLGKINHQLAAYHTSYGSSSGNRRHNVELAAANVNGTLLAPGEVFSYNDVVGPRTARRGWRMAHQFQDGRVVDGIGGGVCQVSSTLYNVVLLSGLKIVQRSHHSMPVAYVHAGRDATVSYGAIDFQFRNNSDGPIFLATRGRSGRLSMAIYGKKPAEEKTVEIVSGRRYGTRSGGFGVSTWRVTRAASGHATRELLSSDTYRPLVVASSAPPRRRTAARRRVRRLAAVLRPAASRAVAPPRTAGT